MRRFLGMLLVLGCAGCRGSAGAHDLWVGGLAPPQGSPGAVDLDVGFLGLIHAVVAAMRGTGNAGSDALAVPPAAERDAFAARVVAILGGDEAAACGLPASYRLARLAGLRVVAEVDAAGQPAPSLMWGTYAAPRALPQPSRR